MIYLFRKFNKAIAQADAANAWEMYSSDGEWKYRPQYLGAIDECVLRDLDKRVTEAFPINSDLIQENNKGDKAYDRELRTIYAQRTKMMTEEMEKIAASADKSVTPRNMNLLNKQTLPKEYHRLADSMTNE